MSTPAELEIVQRTKVGGATVVTARRRDPHAIRQFRTFVVLPSSRYAQNLSDSVSIGATLPEHGRLVHQLDNKRTGKKGECP